MDERERERMLRNKISELSARLTELRAMDWLNLRRADREGFARDQSRREAA